MSNIENKMKLAIVSQPWDGVGMGSSIGIITCQTAQKLVNEYEIFIYAKNGKCKNIESGKINYKYVSLKADQVLIKFLRLLEKFKLIGKGNKPIFSRLIYHYFYALNIALSLRKNRIDIVHIHNYSQFAKIIRIANPTIKIVLHMHCEWLSQLDQKMIAKRISNIDLILGCSNYITDKIKNRFTIHAAKCHAIVNGVDIENFQPGKSIEKKSAKEIKILFVGRVSPEKGVHLLFEVFERLYQENKNVRLDIVGPIKTVPFNLIVGLSEDPKISELKEFYDRTDYKSVLIEKLSNETKDSVTFHGPQDSKKLSAFYQSADIVVNPSYSESFGMSLIEAMACGKPVIASKVGGMVEIIENSKGGTLFEAGNSDELFNELKTVIENEQYRNDLSAGNRIYAEGHYSWESIVNKLNQYYKNA
jgi:glycosyltransferase involved in cell wall biosynthesis